jgi:hypothetical protein
VHGVRELDGGKLDESFRKAHSDWENLFKEGDKIKEKLKKKKQGGVKACPVYFGIPINIDISPAPLQY